MKRDPLRWLLIAVAILVLACICFDIAYTADAAIVTGPRITSVMRTWNGDVQMTWVNASGPQIILWQCTTNGCYDTLRTNTGSVALVNAPNPLTVQICVPGPTQDSCSQTVPVL